MMKSKILLVDDEIENLELLQEFLKDDYTLAFAKNGANALVFAAQKPDLILLDIMMPEMDGYEVCKRLKANKETRDIPVIFVTAKRQIADEIKGLQIGAVDYITKPISPPIVKARIKNHLALQAAYQKVKRQNVALIKADELKQDVERITRHDLKSPISGVIGFSELLLNDEKLSAEQKESVKIILDCGRNAMHMIALSLGLFQMEQGTYALDAHRFDLLPIIRAIQNDLATLVRVKKLTLRLGLHNRAAAATDSFFVQGEEMLCYSMLANLIKNALEASPDGQTVTISLGLSGQLGIVQIHNRGVVPAEIRAHFFDKYVTAGKQGGTGLGTYSAKLIAETLGGKIRMATSEQKGTKIAIAIPLGKTDA